MVAHAQNTIGITREQTQEVLRLALHTESTLKETLNVASVEVKNLKFKRGTPATLKGVFGWPDERVHSPIPPADVQVYCNQDREWQIVRLAMKGLTTTEKLVVLDWWWQKQTAAARSPNDHWRLKVQTSNYITALRRGGLLTLDNWVQRD
jgi:hypothetical protein